MNNVLSPSIHLHRSIRQGFPLPPYLYLLVANDIAYLLEVVHCQVQLQGISLPEGKEMVNNHFVDNHLLSIFVEQD